MDLAELRVDGARLWRSHMAMAEVGATPRGGSCRVALTAEDKAGRDLFVQWCREAGCAVTVDDMGNIFARRPGRDEALAPVAAGSHLDTQPHGGRFDGVYGVLAGLEVVRSLNDHGVETEAPVEVVVWTNEEGARFAPAMLASGVFAGLFERDFALARKDADGVSFGEALAAIGYQGAEPCGRRRLGALFEAHIEQGPILEAAGRTIGVVAGAQGQRWYDVVVHGQDAHAGSTPLPARHDALLAAAQMVVEVRRLAAAAAPHGVGTVGWMQVRPNSRNTIPGEVRFSIDLRHPDETALARMDTDLRTAAARIAAADGVALEVEQIWHKEPVRFDPACVAAVRAAAQRLGYPHQDIVSGAGHDACQVCLVAPTAMIFVPCAGGISHSESESATPEDLEAGCNVLLHAMLATAMRGAR